MNHELFRSFSELFRSPRLKSGDVDFDRRGYVALCKVCSSILSDREHVSRFDIFRLDLVRSWYTGEDLFHYCTSIRNYIVNELEWTYNLLNSWSYSTRAAFCVEIIDEAYPIIDEDVRIQTARIAPLGPSRR